jgi:hypothetical protein
VRNEAGHYQVRMPAQPQRSSQPGTSGVVHYTLHFDLCRSPYLAMIGEEEFDVDLPANQIDEALTTAVSSFSGAAGATVVSNDTTTFRGRKARQAGLVKDQVRYTMMVVAWSSRRIYFFLAPEGGAFTDLSTSFESLS